MAVLKQTAQPIAIVERPLGNLSVALLPIYALRTTLRMLAALAVSFVFTLAYATLAAKSKRKAGMVLIPILDILQSVPVLGFISFTVTFFSWRCFQARSSWRRAGLRFCNIYRPGLEYDIQPVSVAQNGAGRA